MQAAAGGVAAAAVAAAGWGFRSPPMSVTVATEFAYGPDGKKSQFINAGDAIFMSKKEIRSDGTESEWSKPVRVA